MNLLNPKKIKRFREVFPELPVGVAEVVMLYVASPGQVDSIGVELNLTRRQVDWRLTKASQLLELHSIPAIRTVVIARLLLEGYV